MGIRFGRSEIKGDEYLKCLAFLEEITKLMIFQEHEIRLYEDTTTNSSSVTDSETSEKMLEAMYRMYQAASRLSGTIYKSYFTYSKQDNDYHIKSSMPSITFKCISDWKIAYDYFSSAAFQTYDSCRLGGLPSPKVQEYLEKSAMYRTKAIEEMGKLFTRLKLSDEEKETMHKRAANAVDSEEWYPYW